MIRKIVDGFVKMGREREIASWQLVIHHGDNMGSVISLYQRLGKPMGLYFWMELLSLG